MKQEFFAGADAIGLAEKLRAMRLARVADGESFGLLTSNPRVDAPVQLDLKLDEAEQIASPTLAPNHGRYIDGIQFDASASPKSRLANSHPSPRTDADSRGSRADGGWNLSTYRQATRLDRTLQR